MRESGDITQQMVQDLNCDDAVTQMKAVVQIRQLVAIPESKDQPIQELIQKIPPQKFVDLLKNDQNWQLQVRTTILHIVVEYLFYMLPW